MTLYCTEWGADGVCRPRPMRKGEHIPDGEGRAIVGRAHAAAWALLRNGETGISHPDIDAQRAEVEAALEATRERHGA